MSFEESVLFGGTKKIKEDEIVVMTKTSEDLFDEAETSSKKEVHMKIIQANSLRKKICTFKEEVKKIDDDIKLLQKNIKEY